MLVRSANLFGRNKRLNDGGDVTTGPKYRIEIGTFGDHRLVTAKGEIDMASAPELQAALSEEPSKTVLADLADVGFMDSTGLRSLLLARDAIDEAGGQLRLVYGEGPVQRIIDLTGLSDRFEVFETTEAAAESAS